MKLSRGTWISLAVIAACFVLTAVLYPRLPDPMPTHWDVSGTPNGFTPKPFGPFLVPGLLLLVLMVLRKLPALSPRGFGMASFVGVYDLVCVAIIAVGGVVYGITLSSVVGVPLDVGSLSRAAVGVLCIVIGNFMGKLTPNFFLGIRTPWTLASTEVWSRTHRFGGRWFVLGGLTLVVAAFFSRSLVLMTAVIAATALVPAVYSYFVYHRLEGQHHGP
jgi:uncharacterized membrane protein